MPSLSDRVLKLEVKFDHLAGDVKEIKMAAMPLIQGARFVLFLYRNKTMVVAITAVLGVAGTVIARMLNGN